MKHSCSGSPRWYSKVYNRDLRPKLEKLGFYVPGVGAHCFRRFRAAQWQPAACPDDLRKFWLGAASSAISDQYALQLLEDVERRKAAAASVGRGFEVGDSPGNFHYSGLVEAADQPVTQ